MPTLNYSVTVSGLGGNIAQSLPRSANAGGIREIELPVGKAGTLTTRDDNNTGTITMADGGHGITTGAKVDVYWNGGVQYNVTVGTVVGSSVPIDLGVGDNLPTASTAVVVSVRSQINLDIDGDNLVLLAIKQKFNSNTIESDSHIDFQDSGSAQVAEVDLEANGPQVWDIAGGSANPFTGNPITKAFASNGSTTEVATLQLLWLQDATP
ncbi:MAG: hypothetical protein AB7E98_05995 [Pirellulales bacterium]